MAEKPITNPPTKAEQRVFAANNAMAECNRVLASLRYFINHLPDIGVLRRDASVMSDELNRSFRILEVEINAITDKVPVYADRYEIQRAEQRKSPEYREQNRVAVAAARRERKSRNRLDGGILGESDGAGRGGQSVPRNDGPGAEGLRADVESNPPAGASEPVAVPEHLSTRKLEDALGGAAVEFADVGVWKPGQPLVIAPKLSPNRSSRFREGLAGRIEQVRAATELAIAERDDSKGD